MSDNYAILSAFLKSPEWKHTVSTFVDNHCHFFTHDDGGDIDVNMYEIYKNFCDIVDGLFSMTLQDMGVSEEVFADMLADEMRQPDKGPRDKAMKEMLLTIFLWDGSWNYMAEQPEWICVFYYEIAAKTNFWRISANANFYILKYVYASVGSKSDAYPGVTLPSSLLTFK